MLFCPSVSASVSGDKGGLELWREPSELLYAKCLARGVEGAGNVAAGLQVWVPTTGSQSPGEPRAQGCRHVFILQTLATSLL